MRLDRAVMSLLVLASLSFVSAQTRDHREAPPPIDETVRFEVLLASALNAGYDRDPEVVEAIERLIVSKFRREHVDPLLAGVTTDEDEIQQHYAENLADYTRSDRVRIAMIFIEVPARAGARTISELSDEVERVRDEALARASKSADFGSLAKIHSHDRVSKYMGGDVGWVIAGQPSYRWESAVVDAGFALSRPGQISGVIRTPKGLYILKLIDREVGAAQSIERVRAIIGQRLLGEKRKQQERVVYERLARDAAIELDRRPIEPNGPPALPGD